AVDSQVLMGLVAELLELLLVGTLDPACGPDVDRLVGALDLVLFLQTAGDHVELQHPDGAEDDVVVALGEEHLGGAFLGQLLQALAQLLGFQRVLQAHAAEQFRGEVRNAGEAHVLAGGEGVADLDGAVVVQADDVAAVGFLQALAVAGEEGQGVADLDVLADAHMAHLHALLVLAGAHAHEGDAVAVLGVHVRLDLEHEAAEGRLGGQHLALLGHARQIGRASRRESAEAYVVAVSSRRRHTRFSRDWSSDVCSSDLILMSLPMRTWRIFMPCSYLPEHTRMKAMRSRCLGSMFAWILNTKPLKAGSVGSTSRSWVMRG